LSVPCSTGFANTVRAGGPPGGNSNSSSSKVSRTPTRLFPPLVYPHRSRKRPEREWKSV
jgi:hypothetical protein